MTFGQPTVLLLLPVLLVLAGLRWWWGRWLARAQAGIGATVYQASVHAGRGPLRAVLLWLGLVLGVVAAAQPRWGSGETVRSATGADVLVLIDCSRSMEATDLFPTRLEVARRKAIALLDAAPETRLALMPFAGIPVLRCPLTGDRQALGDMLLDCSPDLFPAEHGYQGTAIGKAVREGLGVLSRQVERGQAILLITDGADEDAAAVEAAATATKAAGVPVLGLFVADPDKKPTLVIDGTPQVMTSDRRTLDALALATGGLAVNATLDDADVQALAERLGRTGSARAWEERQRVVASERYQWPLGAALVLLALGALLPTRRTP